MFRRHALLLFVGGVLFCTPMFSSATTTIKAAPTNGLVGYWSFNEGTSTRADDASRYKNHGILNGSPPWVPGKLGKGLQFTFMASNQYVDGGSKPSLDDIPTMSITAWIYRMGDGDTYIATKSSFNALSDGWYLHEFSGGLWFERNFSVTSGKWLATQYFPVNRWTFIALTYDKSSSVNVPTFYINGTAVTTFPLVSPSGTAVSDASENLIIGGQLGTSNGLTKVLDEFRVYNRILSASEIRQIYQAGQAQVNTTPSNSPKTASSLVGWWTFDANAFTQTIGGFATATDMSGNGNGLLVQDSFPTINRRRVPGKIAQGLNSGQSAQAKGSASYNNLTKKTIALWVKPRSIQTGAVLVEKGHFTFGRGWHIPAYGTDGTLAYIQDFNSQSGWWLTNSGILRPGEWVFLAFTYDNTSTANDPIVYVNGVATTTQEMSAPSGSPVSDSAFSSDLFRVADSANGGLPGIYDDVRIYNRILTATEIRDLYNQTRGSTVGQCGQGPVLDADGNKYGIVQIGTQCWLDRNMNVGTRINGFTDQSDNGIVEKYCYNNLDSNCTDPHPKNPDGGLYLWREAMQYSTTEGARGICPAGWHIPTDTEWYTLERFLTKGGGSCNGSRNGPFDCSPSGSRILRGGNSRFEANLAGERDTGSFFDRDSNVIYWTSLQAGSGAYRRSFVYTLNTIGRDYSTNATRFAYPVRCIKN